MKEPAGVPLLAAYVVGAALGMPPAIWAQAKVHPHAPLGVTAVALAAGMGPRRRAWRDGRNPHAVRSGTFRFFPDKINRMLVFDPAGMPLGRWSSGQTHPPIPKTLPGGGVTQVLS